MRKHIAALSVVELLSALAVIATLAAFASPSIIKNIESAKASRCLSNLRALGSAAILYSNDNNGRIPQSSHQGPTASWQNVLAPYLSNNRKLYKSPLAPNQKQSFSYAINDYLTIKPYGAPNANFSRRQSIDYPSKTLFLTLMTKEYGPTDHFHFASSEDGGYTPAAFEAQVQTDVCSGTGHYLFLDGHVEVLSWEFIQTELTQIGSPFIDPSGKQ